MYVPDVEIKVDIW